MLSYHCPSPASPNCRGSWNTSGLQSQPCWWPFGYHPETGWVWPWFHTIKHQLQRTASFLCLKFGLVLFCHKLGTSWHLASSRSSWEGLDRGTRSNISWSSWFLRAGLGPRVGPTSKELSRSISHQLLFPLPRSCSSGSRSLIWYSPLVGLRIGPKSMAWILRGGTREAPLRCFWDCFQFGFQ